MQLEQQKSSAPVPVNQCTSAKTALEMNRRKFMIGTSALATSLIAGAACHAEDQPEIHTTGRGAPRIENQQCRIEFDPKTGGLRRIVNRLLTDDCLKDCRPETMPFRIFADLTREFEIMLNDKFQLVFQPPESICKTLIQPGNCDLIEATEADDLRLVYQGHGFRIELRIKFSVETGVSDWFLRITNISQASRDFLVCFPRLEGLQPGVDPGKNLATAMVQAGTVVPAWEKPGGVFGESNQMSMQWHAIWNPETKSALGLIFMDPDAQPKRLALTEPTLEMHYFPPIVLKPGESCELPPTRLIVYEGDWRPAARAYRAWHSAAYASVKAPDWYRNSNGLTGRHFKKGSFSPMPDHTGKFALESFRELPKVHLRVPVDNTEYAFYNSGSANPNVHTDGDNIIREDMGGAAAMREGIAGVHRVGLHTTLYIEGYIVWEGSELGKSGKAKRWAVMHKDGSMDGPYSKNGFLHLCPGCVEWQDHLAEAASKLLRETGADGIRLDSLGFYYLPCYNRAHRHETPFGYNEWIKALLAKVREAALAVNSNALLTTEGPADWFSPWFHGALNSACSRDLPLMRLALESFRPYVYSACSPIWGSLSGFSGGGCNSASLTPEDENGICARFPVHDALVWGAMPQEIPTASDTRCVTRLFEGTGYWALVVARSNCDDAFNWLWDVQLSDNHVDYSVTLPGLANRVSEAILCDIENLTWSPLKLDLRGEHLLLHLRTNWAMVILRQPGGPALVGFDELPPLQPGDSTLLSLYNLFGSEVDGGTAKHSAINAPGINLSAQTASVPGKINLIVPSNAFPGFYAISVSGKHQLGFKRFLKVG